MTTLDTPTVPLSTRLTRPGVVLPTLAVIVVLVALLTPEQSTRSRGGLSSYSTAPDGARLIADLAARMGWHIERRLTPLDSQRPESVVHVVIGPQEGLGAVEAHRLLEHVRRGGGLIAAMDNGALVDSLHVATRDFGRLSAENDGADCRSEPRDFLGPVPYMAALTWRRPPPDTPAVLAMAETRERGLLPVVVGVRIGRGRAVITMDGDVFRNDVVRVCRHEADLAFARILAYVRDGPPRRTTLLFDEYHHGFGMHPGSIRAITGYLGHTASGHLLLQAVIAGLILLMALGPRPIVPHDPERIARRSPLEHADALAHAYSEVGATRTATVRLVDGVRRRIKRFGAGDADAGVFLQRVAAERPALADEIAIISRALAQPVPPRDLARVGEALHRVEEAFTPTGPS
jgi:hypothetical protein